MLPVCGLASLLLGQATVDCCASDLAVNIGSIVGISAGLACLVFLVWPRVLLSIGLICFLLGECSLWYVLPDRALQRQVVLACQRQYSVRSKGCIVFRRFSGTVISPPQRRRVGELLVVADGQVAGIGFARVQLKMGDLPWRRTFYLQQGSKIQAYVRLRPSLRSSSLDWPMQYSHYLIRRGIALQGSVIQIELLDKEVTLNWKQRLAERYAKDYGESDGVALFFAVVLGMRDLLSPSVVETFRRTGLSHVLVVSGYHIGFLFTAVLFLGSAIPWFPLAILQYMSRQSFWRLAALIAASLYTVLSGAAFSTMRALLALSLAIGAYVLDRGLDRVRAALSVAFLLSLVWPGALFEVGPQLTFAALAGIYWAVGAAPVSNHSGIRALWSVCVWAWLATAPLLLLWFSQFAPAAPLFNLLFGPVISLMLLGFCLPLAILECIFPYWVGPILGGCFRVIDSGIGILTGAEQLVSATALRPLDFSSEHSRVLAAGILFGIAVWARYKFIAAKREICYPSQR